MRGTGSGLVQERARGISAMCVKFCSLLVRPELTRVLQSRIASFVQDLDTHTPQSTRPTRQLRAQRLGGDSPPERLDFLALRGYSIVRLFGAPVRAR